MKPPAFERLTGYEVSVAPAVLLERAKEFCRVAVRRRSIRAFASTPVAREVIEQCLLAAGSAPSGANRQPWHFVAVSDPATKRRIRQAAEKEERDFYHRRASVEWLDALAPLGTDADKPFLETAPWLIAIFAQTHAVEGDPPKPVRNYYVNESVGIAAGVLITALNQVGLGTLTHTPSPMRFLNEVLGRPDNERPVLLLVVGFPAADCQVPSIGRKALAQIASFIE
jgi:iodotyrosine deiodinase